MYKLIEPEVAGGLGKHTQIDNSFFPPIIKKLHYEFDGWLGDDILESFPCYIMTEFLKKAIESEHLTGIIFDEVIISKSEIFLELYPDKELPFFFWAKINGEDNKDDFYITKKNGLAISERAYLLLQKYNISQADIEDLE
ncbi:hypothetical protein EG359_10375 [Chryseobacterium joostei]|uniref:Uncharacterized protein n=1 Tax=Chryseobacterium joostei TaxID=112234 RepID=A0A1N7KJZ5_9FLAO|nr:MULTISPECIES: hypothetical protein [Chryseobacterium]AZA77809.1 hypothetical protein EG347_09905 [Chryseobacterium sp. G0186]AZB00004.1 hypothetical protein EG359_10375 [Chryseobacterium joostei]SIS61919.1 hypothetical protein SAMN05421768_11418 [Chryseobacterium joostei]